MTVQKQIYRCNICGNITEILHAEYDGLNTSNSAAQAARQRCTAWEPMLRMRPHEYIRVRMTKSKTMLCYLYMYNVTSIARRV